MAETVTVKFAEPLKIGDKEYKEVTLREPMAGELRGVSIGKLVTTDVDELGKVIPRITESPNIDAAVFATLRPVPLAILAKEVAGFFMSAE